MPRYKCMIEYDGTGFHGWQKQENLPSIQESIEQALFAFCGENVDVYTAGRTDAGVHATGQVAHFDLATLHTPFKIMSAVNHHLGELPIALLSVETVADDFHARFSASKRHYLYRIVNRRPKLTLEQYRAWHVPVKLDATAMHFAAQHFLGHHDFTSFRDSECQSKSPVKTIDHISVEQVDDEIRIRISAKSFLHHMVRNITGTLKMVGTGKWQPEDIPNVIAAKDRRKAGPTAPACGLYLTRIDY